MTNIHFDAVVVGSGFGGSVSAYRLAQAGRKVCLLERGKAYPPGSFARRPSEMRTAFWDPSEGLHGLFDIWDFHHLSALVSSGLGGGSLIYANVLLRKDEHWFQEADGRKWPVTRADLEPHYDEVEKILKPQKLPFGVKGYDLAKTRAFGNAATAAHLDWHLADLAVTFHNQGRPPVPGEFIREGANLHDRQRRTCTLCGECDVGCNEGAKNTLDYNYLTLAKELGAELRTRCEVRTLSKAGSGFSVTYADHAQMPEGATRGSEPPQTTITCDKLVISAGTLGSTFLLLKNRDALGIKSQALGSRFSGNGDLLAFAMKAKDREGRPSEVSASRGPVITSYGRHADAADPGGQGQGFYIEDAGYPVALEWFTQALDTAKYAHAWLDFAWAAVRRWSGRSPAASEISAKVASLLGDAGLSKSSLPLLGMGRDTADGQFRMDGKWLETDWKIDGSRPYFNEITKSMQSIAAEMGADFEPNPLTGLNRLITVHPLGGCPMGVNDQEGLVDSYGEVFDVPGLFVADGSVMPGPVGANPSLTIAAVANRFADRMTDRAARPPRAPAQKPSAVPPSAKPIRLTVEEWMKGYVGQGATDHQDGFISGLAAGNYFVHDVFIDIDDVDRFVADKDHPARLVGSIDCGLFGGKCQVTSGTFNMFVDGESPKTRFMDYRMCFNDTGGNPWTMFGKKTVHDDHSLDLWSDTTTLYIGLYRGSPETEPSTPDPQGGKGVIHIEKLDLIKSVASFKAPGATIPEAGHAMTAFFRFFLGQIWDVYAPFAPRA
jgi:cholesterol oxidase